jgi:hypothetical protein
MMGNYFGEKGRGGGGSEPAPLIPVAVTTVSDKKGHGHEGFFGGFGKALVETLWYIGTTKDFTLKQKLLTFGLVAGVLLPSIHDLSSDITPGNDVIRIGK